LIAYVDGAVQVLNTDTGAVEYASRDFQGAYETLTFAPDYGLVFIQSFGSLEVRSLIDGSLRGRYESPSFALHPEGAWFAAADAQGNIKITDISTGDTVRSFHAHTGKVLSLAISPDGRYIVSAGQDCRIKLWDLQTGTLLHEFEKTIVNAYGEPGTDSRIFLYFLTFIPGQEQVIGYGSWGTVVSWRLGSGTTRYVIQPEALEYYQGMQTLNPHFPEYFGIDLDGGRIFLNNRMYDLESGDKLGTYELPKDLPGGCFAPVESYQESQMFFTPGYELRRGSICVLSSPDLTLIRALQIFPEQEEFDPGINWIYSSDERNRLYVTTDNGPIFILQVLEGS
jgi:WD40 repeat protein